MPRRRTDRSKIRKRASSYSSATSSSSFVVKNYRLKRAILVGKRAGSSTPVPAWKMGLRSPVLAKQSHGGCALDKGKEAQTSARRLGASLWEINGSQSPGFGDGDGEIVNFDPKLGHTHSPVCTKVSTFFSLTCFQICGNGVLMAVLSENAFGVPCRGVPCLEPCRGVLSALGHSRRGKVHAVSDDARVVDGLTIIESTKSTCCHVGQVAKLVGKTEFSIKDASKEKE